MREKVLILIAILLAAAVFVLNYFWPLVPKKTSVLTSQTTLSEAENHQGTPHLPYPKPEVRQPEIFKYAGLFSKCGGLQTMKNEYFFESLIARVVKPDVKKGYVLRSYPDFSIADSCYAPALEKVFLLAVLKDEDKTDFGIVEYDVLLKETTMARWLNEQEKIYPYSFGSREKEELAIKAENCDSLQSELLPGEIVPAPLGVTCLRGSYSYNLITKEVKLAMQEKFVPDREKINNYWSEQGIYVRFYDQIEQNKNIPKTDTNTVLQQIAFGSSDFIAYRNRIERRRFGAKSNVFVFPENNSDKTAYMADDPYLRYINEHYLLMFQYRSEAGFCLLNAVYLNKPEMVWNYGLACGAEIKWSPDKQQVLFISAVPGVAGETRVLVSEYGDLSNLKELYRPEGEKTEAEWKSENEVVVIFNEDQLSFKTR